MAVTLGNGNITFGDGTVIETSAMVKSIQKGTTVGAGNVTISSITVAKSVIMSSSKGSSGSVAATGTLNLPAQTISVSCQTICLGCQSVVMGCQPSCLEFGRACYASLSLTGANYVYGFFFTIPTGAGGNLTSVGSAGCVAAASGSATAQTGCVSATSGTVSACSSGSISGGSTSLIAKQYSAYIVNSTTIYADGPVEWQVIEYY